ncbi:maleylpyruvate isomerase N-terminal domain-containing protein, partial [Actinophytocola sp.]|uniref:maleylpyruvate isomerase N-terminal domain-containing protein n=1 Tax=Actinophytocola sp. TaxID=1872138 RepID=UPI003D6B4EAB
MVELNALVADLRDESAEVDALVSGLSEDGWATRTPAPGWTVAHQVAHLAWTDRRALLAVTDPAKFQADLAEAVTRSARSSGE